MRKKTVIIAFLIMSIMSCSRKSAIYIIESDSEYKKEFVSVHTDFLINGPNGSITITPETGKNYVANLSKIPLVAYRTYYSSNRNSYSDEKAEVLCVIKPGECKECNPDYVLCDAPNRIKSNNGETTKVVLQTLKDAQRFVNVACRVIAVNSPEDFHVDWVLYDESFSYNGVGNVCRWGDGTFIVNLWSEPLIWYAEYYSLINAPRINTLRDFKIILPNSCLMVSDVSELFTGAPEIGEEGIKGVLTVIGKEPDDIHLAVRNKLMNWKRKNKSI